MPFPLLDYLNSAAWHSSTDIPKHPSTAAQQHSTMASISSPEILLLSLSCQSFFDESYTSLIDSLCKSAQLKRAKTASGTIRYLDANHPTHILVTDEGLTEAKHQAVLDKVVSYVRNGGVVIVGLHFPSFVNFDACNDLFTKAFGLPWKSGDYHRTDFQLNPSCSLPPGVASNSFPPPYSMKTLHVKGAQPHEKIFVPIGDAMTQSHVFSPEKVSQEQAAVVGAKVGDGYVAYVGDVNGEKGSDRVILALCGF